LCPPRHATRHLARPPLTLCVSGPGLLAADPVRLCPPFALVLQEIFNATETAYSMFQLMFAIITPALISGAVVGKIKFSFWLLFVALWHLLVYTPLAHWVFYFDGWIWKYGAIDFAGGLVVHTASGVSALVLAYLLGKSPRHAAHNPHNVPYVLLGAALLWFGW
jgi:Amt family ammonium transporter